MKSSLFFFLSMTNRTLEIAADYKINLDKQSIVIYYIYSYT